MAAFLDRLRHPGGLSPRCTTKPFPDVRTSNPCCGDIAWLKRTGITGGSKDGRFHGGNDVTRGQMAAFLHRMSTVPAARTTLATGTWTAGRDIRVGRYVATAPEGEAGNFVVYAADGSLKVNEILGGDYGVPSVTVGLTRGDSIEISGLSKVTFTFADLHLRYTLTNRYMEGAARYQARPVHVHTRQRRSRQFRGVRRRWFLEDQRDPRGRLRGAQRHLRIEQGRLDRGVRARQRPRPRTRSSNSAAP